MYRTKCRAAQTRQDSALCDARFECHYDTRSYAREIAFLKRQARRANRRNARIQLRTEVQKYG